MQNEPRAYTHILPKHFWKNAIAKQGRSRPKYCKGIFQNKHIAKWVSLAKHFHVILGITACLLGFVFYACFSEPG